MQNGLNTLQKEKKKEILFFFLQEFQDYYWPYQLIPFCLQHFIAASGMMCVSCEKPILENAVIVDGRKFHSGCFVCSKNGCLREFGNSYNLHGGKPFCDEHYRELSGQTCFGCGLRIEEQSLKALGGLWHKKCFACVRCSTPILREQGLPPLQFFSMNGQAICLPCHEVCLFVLVCFLSVFFRALFMSVLQATLTSAPNICKACNKHISGTTCVSAFGAMFCPSCFVCASCSKPLSGGFFNVGGKPYDEQCARLL